MKNLGYERTPTNAKFRVTMPDGTQYDVPVQTIVDSRDENYREDKEDTIGYIRRGTLTGYEISDWAANNMNWSDVEGVAVKVDVPLPLTDFQDGWTNGDRKIVGEI